jgi:two-component system, NarL family, nitrate/nitrite sensor histidine kinase NarX
MDTRVVQWHLSRPAARIPGGAAEMPMQAPIERMLQAVLQVSGARAATLRMLDPEDGSLQLVSAVGVPAGCQLSSQMWRGDDCSVCDDVIHDDTARSSVSSCACARQLSAACSDRQERVFVLPLHQDNTPCGVLNLFLGSHGDLPEAVSALLPALGDMLGLTLENARLSRQAVQASLMRERQRLAGEVHDSLAQSLTWLRMRSRLLRGAIARRDEAQIEQHVAEIDASLGEAHGRVRELITDFRISMDPRGLDAALHHVIDQFESLADLDIDYINRLTPLALDAEQELQVFHIVREALSNIVKHAQASHARIELSLEDGQCLVSIEDDGIGLHPGHENDDGVDLAAHHGLRIMQERAELVGGVLGVSSRRGLGTRLVLQVPVAPTPGSGLSRPVHRVS